MHDRARISVPMILLRPEMLGSGIVSSWLVPALIFLILIGASWAGLRWIRSEHIEALACTPLFSRLPRNTLRSILGSAHAVEFLPGDAIVREGERGKGFFVKEGTARVLVGGIERARLRPGAYFGEIAVIDGGPRTATIAAETQMSTLELAPAAFRRLLDTEPSIASSVSRELARRLQTVGGPRESGEDPVGDNSLEELCARLRRIDDPDWAQPAVSPRRGLRLLLPRRP